MQMDENTRQRLKDAINQVRADLGQLEAHVPIWDSESTLGTKRYRPLAKQIVAAAQRLEQIVREYTY
jgi:hypothetical protein